MTTTDQSNFETRLRQALTHDVETTMTLTDTPQQLERFQRRVKVRRRRMIAVGIAAGVVFVVGATIGGIALSRAGSNHGQTVVNHPSPSPTHTARIVPTVRSLTFGPGSPLPPSVHVTTLKGPQGLGFSAFGAVWAIQGVTFTGRPTSPRGYLDRISLDGSTILSRSRLPGVGDMIGPVRIGNSIVVADGDDSNYTVFNAAGHKIGTLPGTTTAQATGDASGGWIATDVDRLAHVDATGLRITERLRIPGDVTIAALATSPGIIWVGDSSQDRLLRVNAATGAITGQTKLGAGPQQVVYTHGAVYVASGDLSLRRVDPSTMRTTAAITGHDDSPPELANVSNGQLWAQPAEGVITRVNPVTLREGRAIKLFGVDSEGGASGAVIVGRRMFVSDADTSRLYSFLLP